MPTTPKNVKVTKDEVRRVVESLKNLVSMEILVGIPEENGARKNDNSISNAALGYIHEFGSPAANIPARPFLIPGVEKAEKPAIVYLRKAALSALDRDSDKVMQYMNVVGMIAMNKARSEINNIEGPPLKPETIRNRFRSRGTKGMRKAEKLFFQHIDYLEANGYDSATAEYAAQYTHYSADGSYATYTPAYGIGDGGGLAMKPLINTGQLRNSITYVISGDVHKRK